MIDPSRRNRFTALSLDRHDALRNNPATLAALWNDARVVAVDFEGNAAGDANAPFAFDSAQLPPLLHEAACFLGHNPGEPAWFALPASVLSESLKATVPGWIDLRTAARHWSAFDSALFAYAKALLLWIYLPVTRAVKESVTLSSQFALLRSPLALSLPIPSRAVQAGRHS